ncbi:hypothetical protein WJR50_32975 [Catalinimonas sp. 4WD22]|uniref:hypothetical protein n=1 Tax=Catalinimonas locisalis TaxID=3133978 RepID=UPI0031012BEB
MKKIFAVIVTILIAGLPIVCRYLIFTTETIESYQPYLLSDWLFFSIAINLSIVNLLANESRIMGGQSLSLTVSYILVIVSSFVLALAMYVPELNNKANMTALNNAGIVLVSSTTFLYFVVIFKVKDIGHA